MSSVFNPATWIDAFFFAGSSALLLLMIRLYPSLWYLSFVALIPFLYRILTATVGTSARLGFVLGFCFIIVAQMDELVVSPVEQAAIVLIGSFMFALFGASISWTRREVGANPIFVALLWIIFELGLVKLASTLGLFNQVGSVSGSMYGLATLFGFLAVSFIIILFNTLLVLALRLVASWTAAERRIPKRSPNCQWVVHDFNARPFYICLVPESRGPPLAAVC